MTKSIVCPICEARAEEDPGTFHGVAVNCGSCGEFEISATLHRESKWQALDRNGRLAALERAKKHAPAGGRPRITTDHIVL